MRILITGGAGFVGSSLARLFRRDFAQAEITAFDNLKRRGSELNLPRFKREGIRFVHGDIRQAGDLDALAGEWDLLIEASAEPSVLAGLPGADVSARSLLEANLVGTLNCLEFARKRARDFIFLSTSRVYSIAPLQGLTLKESGARFELAAAQSVPGVSEHGIAETFPTHLPRSLYGASKLASELVIQEYAASLGVRALINRCGVIAGPGQFGKVDQGVFTLWVANHYFGKPLRYTGFGGKGHQVRDLLHPEDLYDLIRLQLPRMPELKGSVYNVGGGRPISTSLRELTALCEKLVDRKLEISGDASTSTVDIPLYLSDSRLAEQTFRWRPKRGVDVIVREIADWIRRDEAELRPVFV